MGDLLHFRTLASLQASLAHTVGVSVRAAVVKDPCCIFGFNVACGQTTGRTCIFVFSAPFALPFLLSSVRASKWGTVSILGARGAPAAARGAAAGSLRGSRARALRAGLEYQTALSYSIECGYVKVALELLPNLVIMAARHRMGPTIGLTMSKTFRVRADAAGAEIG